MDKRTESILIDCWNSARKETNTNSSHFQFFVHQQQLNAEQNSLYMFWSLSSKNEVACDNVWTRWDETAQDKPGRSGTAYPFQTVINSIGIWRVNYKLYPIKNVKHSIRFVCVNFTKKKHTPKLVSLVSTSIRICDSFLKNELRNRKFNHFKKWNAISM